MHHKVMVKSSDNVIEYLSLREVAMNKFDDQELNDLYEKFTKPPVDKMEIPMIGYNKGKGSNDFDYIVTKGS
ncbi:hypothetical protein B4903_16670, partial [Yersinia frederiksenii]